MPTWPVGYAADISKLGRGNRHNIAASEWSPQLPDRAYICIKRHPDTRNNETGLYMLHNEGSRKRYSKDISGVKRLSENPRYDPINLNKNIEGLGLAGKVIGHWVEE